MKSNFCDEKFLRIMDEFAAKHFEQRGESLSFDKITNSMMQKVKWSMNLNFSQASNFLRFQESYLSRLDYYYDQLIKRIYYDEPIELSSPYYIDFWNCLKKTGLLKPLEKYKFSVIDCSNSFEFLKDMKAIIKKANYVTRFKIKTIEMMKHKGESLNEVK